MTTNHDFLDNLANHQHQKMLREIANDDQTPKKTDSLKETENIKYTNIENIKKEIQDAKKTFQKYRWPSIDVTRKSVEETAASIIKIHEIYLNNVR